HARDVAVAQDLRDALRRGRDRVHDDGIRLVLDHQLRVLVHLRRVAGVVVPLHLEPRVALGEHVVEVGVDDPEQRRGLGEVGEVDLEGVPRTAGARTAAATTAGGQEHQYGYGSRGRRLDADGTGHGAVLSVRCGAWVERVQVTG